MAMKKIIFSLSIAIASTLPAIAADSVLDFGNFENPANSYTGTATEEAPVIFGNKHSAVQMIIPADDLQSIKGKDLTKLTFKYASTATAGAYNITVRVYLTETNNNEFTETDDFYHWGGYFWWGTPYMTTEYKAEFKSGDGTFSIDLKDKPFPYQGQSILLTIVNDSETAVPGIRFYCQPKSSDQTVRALTFGSDTQTIDEAFRSNGNTDIHKTEYGSMLHELPVIRFAYGEPQMFDAFSGGKGTEAEPYLISSVKDIQELDTWTNNEQTLGRYFKLTTDLSLPQNVYVGTRADFTGTFDGGNHCITVNIENNEGGYSGLFASTLGATIRNLYVDGRVYGSGGNIGGIIGAAGDGCLIEDVANFANVVGGDYSYIGGITGAIICTTSRTTVRNVANFGTISCLNPACMGGITGYSGQRSSNNYSAVANFGHIDTETGSRTGGIIGNPMSDNIRAALNVGTVSNRNTSPILGYPRGQISGTFYDLQYVLTDYVNDNVALPTKSIVGDGLTSASLEGRYSADEWLFAEDMFPMPKMNGMEQLARFRLFANPLILADGDNLGSISKPFTAIAKNGVRWTSSAGKVVFNADGKVVKMTPGYDELVATVDGFEHIVPINIKVAYDSSDSGLTDASATSMQISGITGAVIIENASESTPFDIFDAAGSRLRSGQLHSGHNAISLPAGLYIVRTEAAVRKVIVQ